MKYYCWWLKACTTWDVWNPISIGNNYLSTGAGFQPSTVSVNILAHQPKDLYHWENVETKNQLTLVGVHCRLSLKMNKEHPNIPTNNQLTEISLNFLFEFTTFHYRFFNPMETSLKRRFWEPLEERKKVERTIFKTPQEIHRDRVETVSNQMFESGWVMGILILWLIY